jgi:hypothetical protein
VTYVFARREGVDRSVLNFHIVVMFASCRSGDRSGDNRTEFGKQWWGAGGSSVCFNSSYVLPAN